MAGAFIGLTALYWQRPAPAHSALIAAGAKALVESRMATPAGGKAWRDRTCQVPQVGLMHGASGIALALYRAGDILHEPALIEAAQDGLSYEAALFERFGHWPDLRDVAKLIDETNANAAYGYAHGADGIGLARIAMADRLQATQHECEENLALALLSSRGPAETDGVFSGRFGRLAFKDEFARSPNVSALWVEVRRQTQALHEEVGAAGCYRWRYGTDGQNPPLFDCAAGAALVLLRMA